MGVISDAAMLPQLQESGIPNFMDGMQNANAIADEGLQTVTDAAKQKKAAEVQQAPFQSITHKFNPKTGKYDVSVDMAGDTFDYLGNLLQTGQATMQAFGQARAQLQTKRQFQEQHPIISAVGKIASVSAAQYAGGGRGRDISPIVRAAGAYGLEQFGQTNAELSQQEAALTGQQFGVANQLYNQNQQDEALQVARAREDRRDKEAIQREQSTAIAEYSRDARSGLIGNEDIQLLKRDLKARGLAKTDEEAAAIADSLAKVGDAKKALAASVQEAAAKKQAAQNDFELQKTAVVANAQTSRMLAGFAFQSSQLEKKLTAQGEIADAKKAAKEIEVPKTLPDKLANLRSAETSLDLIESKIRKFSAYQGVVAGRTVGPAKAYFNRDLSNFYTNLKLEVAQTIKSTGAGARGFGPMERVFFERLATAKDHSPEENLGVIDAWRQYIRQNRGAYVDVYQGLNDSKYAKVLGKDSDLISISSPDAPKTANANATAAASGVAIARAPQGTPDGPIQYKGKPALVKGGVIYAQ